MYLRVCFFNVHDLFFKVLRLSECESSYVGLRPQLLASNCVWFATFHISHTHTFHRCLQVPVYLFTFLTFSYEEGFSQIHTLTGKQIGMNNKVKGKIRLWTWQLGTPCSCIGRDHSAAFKANLNVKEKKEIFDTPLDPAEPFHSKMLFHSSKEENKSLKWNISISKILISLQTPPPTLLSLYIG